jgi:ceramide glucosyltransferase
VAALIVLYATVQIVRFALAWGYARAGRGGAESWEPVAILQPILSGDPALTATLRANAEGLGAHHLYWLVDDDDAAGRAAAEAAAGPNVRILSGPGPRDGENPKVVKLARALAQVTESVTVVLDDDTRITEPNLARLVAALDSASLVTGLPVFTASGNLYERFVGGFINGSALLTYLPASALRSQHTINGMIYAFRSEELRQLGGFAAIAHELTDDYAMARLYEEQGRRVVQTAVPAAVGMTVRGAGHCGGVLRRWMIFANRYVRRNAGPALFLVVGLPAVLPLAGLCLGWPWVAALFAKSLCNRALLWHITGHRMRPLDPLFEVAADILTLPFFLSSLILPGRMQWRSRRIAMQGDQIRYR